MDAMYLLLIRATNEVPDGNLEPEDVVAGWTAFALFGLGILAIVLLGFSLTKRLKNVNAAEEAGLYDPSTKQKRSPIPGADDPSDTERTD